MKIKKENIYWGEIPFYMSIIAAMVFCVMVLLADRNDIPSRLICKYGIKETMIGVFFCIVIAIICFGRRNISDLLKMPCGNTGDATFVFNIIACILIGICEEILGIFALYKLIILLSITSSSIFIIIARCSFCRIRKIKANNVSDSVVDLGQLVSGEVTEYKLPLIFSEEA